MAIETEIVGTNQFPGTALAPHLLDELPAGRTADRTEFDRLLITAAPRLYRLALRMGANRYDARDLVQDTLERALKRHQDFTIGTNLEAWLATIMRRIHIDRYRKTRRWAEPLPTELLAAPEPETQEPATGIAEEDVWTAVERLPQVYRKAYLLFAAQGRSYREIADDLGISPRTVGTRILRARRQLRQILAPATA